MDNLRGKDEYRIRKRTMFIDRFSPESYDFRIRQVFWLVPYFTAFPLPMGGNSGFLVKRFRTYSYGDSS